MKTKEDNVMKRFLRNNLVYIILASICFIVMVYTNISDKGYINVLVNYFSNAEQACIMQQLPLDTCSLNTILDYLSEVAYFNGTSDVVWGTNNFQLFLPFLVMIIGIKFYNQYNTILRFSLGRYQKWKTRILKIIAINSIKTAGAVFLSFTLYACFLIVMTNILDIPLNSGAYDATVVDGMFLTDLFGNNFYHFNPFRYHIIEGFFKFFMMPFVYAFFAQSIALVLKSKKQVLIAPLAYYYGVAILGYGIYALFGQVGIYFNPTALMAIGAYSNFSSIIIILMNCIPLFVSLFIIWYKGDHLEM